MTIDLNLDAIPWSKAARSVWAKTDSSTDTWLPLTQHLSDASGVADALFLEQPQSIAAAIADSFGGDIDEARTFVAFMASLHDLGKASRGFAFKAALPPANMGQLCDAMRNAGLPVPPNLAHPIPHGVAGQAHLRDWLKREVGGEPECASAIAGILGGHHGLNPSYQQVSDARDELENDGPAWSKCRDEFVVNMATATGADRYLKRWMTTPVSLPTQVLVEALVIEADWIASNERLFPYVLGGSTAVRVKRALATLHLPPAWHPSEELTSCDDAFSRRFPVTRPTSLG